MDQKRMLCLQLVLQIKYKKRMSQYPANISEQLPLDKIHTIADILEQDSTYFYQINKSLSPQLLTGLCQILLQQRDQTRRNGNSKIDKINDLEVSLEHERAQFSQIKDYVRVLEEECENLRNLISFKQHENQRKINELSQSSISMMQQMASQLKKQRDINLELKNALKQLKIKENQIRKLTISMSKLNQQNESLKQLKNWNKLLSEQFLQSEQKLATYKVQQKQLRDQNQRLLNRIQELQEKIEQFQYIACNQMTKVKQLLSENLGSCQPHNKNKQNDTKFKQNADLLKEIENNYEPAFFEESIVGDKQERLTKTEKGKARNQIDFENSLDEIFENLDKFTLKQIQASSKGKIFTQNIFNVSPHEIQIRGFETSKAKKVQNSILDSEKINQFVQEQHFAQIPLSLQTKRDKKQSEIQIKNQQKSKINLQIKIPQNQLQQTPFSSRSQKIKILQNDRMAQTPQDQVKQIRSRSKTNTQLHESLGESRPWFRNKQKQIQGLQKKLKEQQQANKNMETQIRQLQQKVLEQINAFKEQTYFQIETIERLTGELEEQKIKSMDELRKKDETYSAQIQHIQKMCKKYEENIKSLNSRIEGESKMKQQLAKRLMQVEQEKWQYNHYQITKQQKLDCCTQSEHYNKFGQIKVFEISIGREEKPSGSVSVGCQYQKHYNKFRQIKLFEISIDKGEKPSRSVSVGCQYQKHYNKFGQIKVFEISIDKEGKSSRFVSVGSQCQKIEKKSMQVQTDEQKKQKITVQRETNTNNQVADNLSIGTQVKNNQLIQMVDQCVGSNEKMKYETETKSQAIQTLRRDYRFIYKLCQTIIRPTKRQLGQKGCQTMDYMQNKALYARQKEKIDKNKEKIREKWGIKQFKPTSLLQELTQRYEHQQQIQPTTDKTMFYSFCEEEPEQFKISNLEQFEPCLGMQSYPPLTAQSHQKQRQKQKQKQIPSDIVDLLKISSILQKCGLRSNLKLSFKLLQDFRNQQPNHNFLNMKMSQVVQTLKKDNCRRYFVFLALLRGATGQSIPDKVLFWKQGMISMKMNGYLIMGGLKKYIQDPINIVLGNCEITLEKGNQILSIKRAGKRNYFSGNLPDCSWKIITVQLQGNY